MSTQGQIQVCVTMETCHEYAGPGSGMSYHAIDSTDLKHKARSRDMP